MKKRTINLGPFGIYLWGGLLAIGGASWGAGAWLTANPQTGRIYPEQLANGTPVPGYVPVAGYCTSTATGTSVGTSADRQCWKPVPSGLPSGTPGQIAQIGTQTTTGTSTGTGWQAVTPPFVYGTGTLSGTTNYIPKKTEGGWGDSSLNEAAGAVDSSKVIRAMGYATPASGAGMEMFYVTGSSYLMSYNRTASSFLPLNVSSSQTTFVIDGSSTLSIPLTRGTAGQALVLTDGIGSTSWSNVVTGLGTGTTNYITRKTVDGWGNSHFVDNDTDTTLDQENLTIQKDGAPVAGLKGASATAATSPEVRFTRSRGSIASPSAVSVNDTLGTVSFYGRTSGDQIAASLSATDNGTAGAGYILGKMCLNISDGTNNGANIPAICATSSGVTLNSGATTTLSIPTAAGSDGQVLTRVTGGGTAWQTPSGGAVSYYDSTPAAVGATGSAGTSALVSHGDHAHALGAHATTHVTGGSDVIANVVASGNSGLMTGADKAKLDNATATPTASRIPIADGSGKLDAWLSGKTLVNSRSYIDGDFFVTSNSTWTNKVAHTFTATGTLFLVHLEAIFADGYNNGRLCGLGVMADTGSTASTLRGNGGFWAFPTADASGYDVLFSSKYINGYITTDVYVSLSAGTVTFALAMWGKAGGYTCAIPASSATMIIHEFK